MRPIRLTISGWGPYPMEETIDFSRFEKGSMFLITGPTGSGKTTIFDAITYAIYGTVSGKTRDKNSVRSDFAKEDMDTFVELVFSHKGKTIQIRRSPKQERKKKRGNGVIIKNEMAELTLDDNPPITVLKDVNRYLIEIMGFSYEQYKQIAMIAQGEFMELLLASSKERVEIFRNLFKTGAYERIQKKLTDKVKQQYQEIQAIRHRMEEAKSMIDTNKDDVLVELLDKEYPSYDKIRDALRENIKCNQVTIKELQKKIMEIEGHLFLLKGKGQTYFELLARFDKLNREVHLQEKKVQQGKEQYENTKTDKEVVEDKIKQETEEINFTIELLSKEKEGIQKELLAFETLESQESELRLRIEQVKNEKEGFVRLHTKRKEVEEQAKYLKTKQEAYTKGVTTLKEITKTYEEKEQMYKSATIGIVARLIEEGKPCPVCGSLEHPLVATLSKEVPDEKEVKLWKTKCENEKQVLEGIYQKAAKEKGILEAMEKELAESFVYFSVTEETFMECYQEVLKKEKELEAIKANLKERKIEKNNWINQAEQIERKLDKKKKQKEEKRDDAEKLRLSMIEKVNQQKTEWETQKAIYHEKNKELQKLSKEEADLSQKLNVDKLKEEIKCEEAKKRNFEIQKEEINARLNLNKSAMESIKEKINILTEKEEIYSIYSNLENVTKGNNKDRVVFEHYVLAAYFEDVLQAANLRLTGMTGGRYELMKVRKVADARTTDSLDLEVLDNYTGKTRSVKTLSGGESFKAALSMALGLSDIVQSNVGGIHVETLFIDEGFGSLDEESLDQALESLMKLSGCNQMIGIISHVNELKERMEKQIVIKKEKNGSKILPLA